MPYLAALSLLMCVVISLMSGDIKVKLYHKGLIKMDSLRLRNINAAMKKALPGDRRLVKKMRAYHLLTLFFLYAGAILFFVWLYSLFIN